MPKEHADDADDADDVERARAVAPVPLVILTGFLGAGKTTLLNRVLATEHRRKIAVLVNELGKIDIDAGLIRARAGDIVELSGGCVCHQLGVQRELWSALDEIILRARPDAVILETSGVAEPIEIVRGLADWKRGQQREDEDDRGWAAAEPAGEGLRHLGVAAIVTVVDAQAAIEQIGRHDEAAAQVRAADQLVLSKTELVSPAALAALHEMLARLNPRAERIAFPANAEGTAMLAPWLVQLAARAGGPYPYQEQEREPQAAADAPGPPEHPHQLAAASYVDEAPLVAEALLLVCRGLGARLVRAKGWVHLVGEARRGFLEVAGLGTELRMGEAWRPDETPTTRLVLIGEGLDDETVRLQLWACRAPARPPNLAAGHMPST